MRCMHGSSARTKVIQELLSKESQKIKAQIRHHENCTALLFIRCEQPHSWPINAEDCCCTSSWAVQAIWSSTWTGT